MIERKYGDNCSILSSPGPDSSVPSHLKPVSTNNPSYFDADRLPGMGEGGKHVFYPISLIYSLLGPQSFRRKGPLGEDGMPVSPSCVPPGARFDPYAPSIQAE